MRNLSGEHRCGMTTAFYPKDSSALRKVFQGLASSGSLDPGMPTKMISKSCPMPMPGHTTFLQQLHAINLGKGNSRIVGVFLALASPYQGELRELPCLLEISCLGRQAESSRAVETALYWAGTPHW